MQTFEEVYQQWAKALTQHKEVSKKENGSGQSPRQETDRVIGYETALQNLIAKLKNMTSVYPTAQLHDMHHLRTDISPVQLGKTVLGTI